MKKLFGQSTSYQVFLPENIVSATATGSIDGVLLFDAQSIDDPSSSREVAGFVVETASDDTTTDAISVANNVFSIINAESGLSASNISIRNESQALAYSTNQLLVSTAVKPTDLINRLIALVGSFTVGGTISGLPQAEENELLWDQFHLSITVSFAVDSRPLLTLIVYPEGSGQAHATEVSNLVDGSNVGLGTDPIIFQQDAFTAVSTEVAKADFLFVIDNSGSMEEEQDAVMEAANVFVAEMNVTSLDYQMGVIATDSDFVYGDGFTNDLEDFQSTIVLGTDGSSRETGIYYAESVLQSIMLGDEVDGTVTQAGIPRQGASLSIVIMSDEESQYTRRSPGGVSFDPLNNLFVSRGYRVYSIINFADHDISQYDDLAFATGGLISSISDTSVFPDIMSTIATDAGSTASPYVLTLPAVPSTLRVYVDNVEVQNGVDGWQYFESAQTIIFRGSSIPSEGANIEVVYQSLSAAS